MGQRRVDILRSFVDATRERGLEVFYTYRLNGSNVNSVEKHALAYFKSAGIDFTGRDEMLPHPDQAKSGGPGLLIGREKLLIGCQQRTRDGNCPYM